MSYNSKYKGKEVEEILDSVSLRNVGAVDTNDSVEDPDNGGGSSSSSIPEWKSVFDGKLSVGDSKVGFSTYADGTPLQAKELLIQIVHEEAGTKMETGYVQVQSTTNKNLSYYGPINYAGTSNDALVQVRLTASPIAYTIAEFSQPRHKVGTISNSNTSGGGLTNRFEIYEDFVFVQLYLNSPSIVPPYVKIVAR